MVLTQVIRFGDMKVPLPSLLSLVMANWLKPCLLAELPVLLK